MSPRPKKRKRPKIVGKRRFQVLFEGTIADIGEGQEEMEETIRQSFKPDPYWGVDIMDEAYIVLPSNEEDEE